MKTYEDIRKEIWDVQQAIKEYLRTDNKTLLSDNISFSCPIYNNKIEAHIQPISVQIFTDPYYSYETVGYLVYKNENDPVFIES